MIKHLLARAINPLIVRLHNDPIEYEQRIIKSKAKIHDVFDELADEYIQPNDSILDLGCGTGAVAKILNKHGHYGKKLANDISESMVEDVLNKKLYTDGFHGTAEELVENMQGNGEAVDWAIALSVFYYFTLDELSETLNALYQVCNKGLIVSLDGIPRSLVDDLSKTLGSRLELYDHRGYFKSHALPENWKFEVKCSGFGWQSSKSSIEVPIELVVLTKNA